MKYLLLLPIIFLLAGCQSFPEWSRNETLKDIDLQIQIVNKCSDAGLGTVKGATNYYCDVK
jgi:starvation-inducible outer membrane lipoprotein